MTDTPSEPADPPTEAGGTDSPNGDSVDDVEATRVARGWALDQLRAGGSPEWTEAALRESGWSVDEAAEMVEEAQQHMRGITSPLDVPEAGEAAYPGRRWPDGAAPLKSPTLAYEAPPVGKELERLRRARFHALAEIVFGVFLLLPGLLLLSALLESSGNIGETAPWPVCSSSPAVLRSSMVVWNYGRPPSPRRDSQFSLGEDQFPHHYLGAPDARSYIAQIWVDRGRRNPNRRGARKPHPSGEISMTAC